MPRKIMASLGVMMALLVSCGARSAPEPQTAAGLTLQVVAQGFEHPLDVVAPARDPRLFIVEQAGRIRVVKNGQLLRAPFLDLGSRVSYGGERGLLSMAFHPDYARNGFFYVNYTDKAGDTQVERFRVGADPDRADPESRRTILTVRQPFSNHNGGHLLFGPDGMLYIGMGDGGSGGDPHGNGQNRASLLGKLLRLDVDHGEPYAIPRDNPFATAPGARGEIWALGLRNPWRFCFDPAEHLLYIADVGQNAWEEVDVADARRGGLNYGWNEMEGNHCYGSAGCDTAGLAPAALEYDHSQGCSVIGGFVYRGALLPELAGHCFYADYCERWVRSFRWRGGRVTEGRRWRLPRTGAVLSFGQDAKGELYLCTDDGKVYRFVKG